MIRLGTAGWTIPKASAHHCETSGTHLQRYAGTLPCVEINSAFYRPHSAKTYARWAAATPPEFRFSIKVPRVLTHDQALRRPLGPLARFLDQTRALGDKRGPLLVQLPPSLAFDRLIAGRFFGILRERHDGPVVCEPRHPGWFTAPADRLLRRHRVARAAADPVRALGAEEPGGWDGLVYYRLHGSPRTYWSRYDEHYLEALARRLESRQSGTDAWVIFDNTAAGAAFENAWELQQMLSSSPRSRSAPSPAAASSRRAG
jgi:uncharacterized protein YecE (DUF72 family)